MPIRPDRDVDERVVERRRACPSALEQLAHGGVERRRPAAVGGEDDRALADLDRRVGHDAVDGRARDRPPRRVGQRRRRRGSRRPPARAARPRRRLVELGGLVAEDDERRRARRRSALDASASPPTSAASARARSASTSVHSTGSPQPRASAPAMFRADAPDPHEARLRGGETAARAQDWLKKPFSISCARSSAEISTLRGVSMKTLSAMRCMPPSSA